MSLSPGARFDRLVAIMHLLRGPDGCPWDREQTLQSLRPFVIEETSELLDALDAGDMTAFKDELGDFLFEAVFLAELCAEAGHFTIADSVQSVIDKLIRRHPHVFTPEGDPLPKNTTITASGVKAQWDDIKQEERAAAGQPEKTTLSGIPRALPALLRADQLSRKAASVGFDWQRAAVTTRGRSSDEAEEELGDLLFALANLARKMGISPEQALRRANDKFQDRFEHMERAAHADGQTLGQLSPADLDARWNAAKRVTGNTKSTKHTKDTE
jgi:tetrapyrrole methylase family protein / MazG family protein